MKNIREILREGVDTRLGAGSGDKEPSSRGVVCQLCQDRGIVLEGEVAKPCTCMQQKKLENRFRYARMARSLMHCRFEQFNFEYYDSVASPAHRANAHKAYAAAREFVENCEARESAGLGLLFIGPVGSGKTFLAACIANALIERDKRVLFLVVPDLLDELRATFSNKGEFSEIDLLDTAREIPILVLDDLGAHNYTEWTRNRIYSIINFRLNQQLPTVITSNLSLEDMENYLGDRTTSRLLQMSRVFRLTCDQDIRLRKYQEREGLTKS